MDLTAAARAALLAMIDWLEAEHGLSRPAAYCLCSACVDLHLSEVVDIPYPLVSALIPLDVFEGGHDWDDDVADWVRAERRTDARGVG
jgi:acetamidase/formamidase